MSNKKWIKYQLIYKQDKTKWDVKIKLSLKNKNENKSKLHQNVTRIVCLLRGQTDTHIQLQDKQKRNDVVEYPNMTKTPSD